MPTVAEVLGAAREALSGAQAAGDAELLLGHALGWGRSRLLTYPEHPVDPGPLARFTALVNARAAGVPAAYLLGGREFWSLWLELDGQVLVPRPDTETLVELALHCLAGRRAPRIADLGTGSGAVGLALATERPDALVDLVDLSPAAVEVARRNAARLGLERVVVHLGDWYRGLPDGVRYDLLVANPPYLSCDDPHLTGPALAHEPRLALVAGPSGLECLGALIAGAAGRLEAGGWLCVEHGASQGDAVRALCLGAGLRSVTTQRDLAGHERATAGQVTG